MSKIAVIETGGKQYIVKENQVIKIEKLPQKSEEKVVFDKILLVSEDNGKDFKLGTPYLETKVEGIITEQGRDKKIRVVKYKPKIRYKKVSGHRQNFTKVKISKIG
jgi:large subunit ribosomal protein L21